MSKEKDKEKESGLGDMLKKVVGAGVGAAFMTEEAVKNVLKDLPISKDIISGLLDNAKNTKKEFISGVREEVSDYLNKIDLRKVADYVAENYNIEFKATVGLKKKESKDNDKN